MIWGCGCIPLEKEASESNKQEPYLLRSTEFSGSKQSYTHPLLLNHQTRFKIYDFQHALGRAPPISFVILILSVFPMPPNTHCYTCICTCREPARTLLSYWLLEFTNPAYARPGRLWLAAGGAALCTRLFSHVAAWMLHRIHNARAVFGSDWSRRYPNKRARKTEGRDVQVKWDTFVLNEIHSSFNYGLKCYSTG